MRCPPLPVPLREGHRGRLADAWLRSAEELAHYLRHQFRPAAGIRAAWVARSAVIEAGERDPPGVWQHRFQRIQRGFQVGGTLAATEQQYLGVNGSEALQIVARGGDQRKV